MLTADTITAEQIREVRRMVVDDPLLSSAHTDEICHVCWIALDDGRLPHRIIKEARARCAEILNARNQEGK